MKSLIVFLLIFPSAFAQNYVLSSGTMEYRVKHLIKTVSATSKAVKGKMICGTAECEFLLGTEVKSFVSSDANRDSNMLTTTEATKFPVTSATGKIGKDVFEKEGKFSHEITVDFHGQKKVYTALTEVTADRKLRSSFTLKLDQHGIERPSLFGVKIDDEVPMTLDMVWTTN